MNKIKIGIIGCGKQAAKHIESLKKIPGIDIWISDIEPELARKLAEEKQVQLVKEPGSIISDSEIRGIVICTPTRSHNQIIRDAIASGKHVLCEKPLSDSIKEIESLEEIVSRSKNVVAIGYIYRYVPIFDQGYRIFSERNLDGESLILGRPLTAFFRLGGKGGHQLWKHQKSQGGGAINEMLVHMIDLANWYFGPLDEISAISCDIRSPIRSIQGELHSVDAEDYILMRCKGENGVEIFCQADLITPVFSQYVEIQCENGSFMGSIQADMPNYLFLNESRGGFAAGKTELHFGRRNFLDIQMMSYIQAIMKNESMGINTVTDSLNLIKTVDEIRKQLGDNYE